MISDIPAILGGSAVPTCGGHLAGWRKHLPRRQETTALSGRTEMSMRSVPARALPWVVVGIVLVAL
ncbi:hypothetical protein, partial [Kocuria arenosa]|uniref:hypothetical protein n=1 Tax=Kocuria arenosa TaxID=3071446 RepID=UPI0034D407F9